MFYCGSSFRYLRERGGDWPRRTHASQRAWTEKREKQPSRKSSTFHKQGMCWREGKRILFTAPNKSRTKCSFYMTLGFCVLLPVMVHIRFLYSESDMKFFLNTCVRIWNLGFSRISQVLSNSYNFSLILSLFKYYFDSIGVFGKLRGKKMTISIVMSVFTPAGNSSTPNEKIFVKIHIWEIKKKSPSCHGTY